MNGAAIMEALMAPEGRDDPYRLYAEARRHGPVIEAWPGVLLVTGYAEVNEVLRNPAFGHVDYDRMAEISPESAAMPSLAVIARSVLDANPPSHKRVRSLMSAVFTPRRTAGLEPAIKATVGRLLDAVAAAGRAGAPVDFMAEFAFALPVSVICELIGVPEADRAPIRGLSRELTTAFDMSVDHAVLGPANEAALTLAEYFTGLVAARRAEPRDDLAGVLVREAGPDGAGLTEEELISNLIFLLVAGFETTTNLFGNGLALLFEQPALAAGLRSGGLPCADFVEEVLRFDSPVQFTSRVALTDGLRVGGKRLPCEPGAEALLLVGAANRDPKRFADADRFDPLRVDNAPLTFGAGAHYCLGAALARLEVNTALPMLLDRFPDLAPAGPPVRGSRYNLRGYEELPVYVSGQPDEAR